MLDIHCHILHGLDDGSDNIEESVRMAKLAVEGGTKAIIATPHSNIPESYQNHCDMVYAEKFRDLNNRLKNENINLKIFPGHEIFAAGNFIELIKRKKLLTLNNSDYPLVEFAFAEYSDSVYTKLRMLIAEGLTPIIAHPERYAFVIEDEYAPFRLKNMGCLLQINKGSLKGSFGKAPYTTAHTILESELADFVASDAHSPYMRTPFLADAREIIGELYSNEYADLLLWQNPMKVLQNKKIN